MADIPKIRFKGFTEPWEQRKLSDIAVLTSSKRVHAEDYVETGVPFYRGKEISELKEHKPISEVLYITEYKYNEISSMYGSPKEGDLLITAVGTLGNTWVIDQTPFYFKDGNLIWFKDIKCNPKYLDYAMSTADGQKKILASAIGSNQKALTMVKLNELEFMFPGKAEQDKIAEYFSYLDNLITLHQRKCDDTKELKKYMLQKMFPKNGEKFPEIRFKGFTEAWEQRKLGDIATFINGRAYSQEELLSSGKYKVLRVGNFYTNDSWYYSDLELDDKYYAEEGDLLYTWSATFGPHIWRGDKVIYHYHIWKVELSEHLEKRFAVQLLEQDKATILSDKNGSTMVHITKAGMEEKIVLIPKNVNEQAKIGAYLDELDNLITLHQRKYFIIYNKLITWEQRKVSEYANFFTGNGLNWNDISDDGEQECILYGNLYTDYGMITENIVYRTNTEIKNPVYSEYGDVLIPASDTTPTGLARATSLEKSGVLLGGDINIIRPNEGINGSCLSLALNANRKELIRLIKGTTVRHIHNSEIKDIVICLPKLETEQVRVSSYFKQLDHLITLHRRAL